MDIPAGVVEIFSTAKWILALLLVYLLVVFFIGLRYSKRISESDDWALAGRQFKLPFIVPSIVATWICAEAIMGAAGRMRKLGYTTSWWKVKCL